MYDDVPPNSNYRPKVRPHKGRDHTTDFYWLRYKSGRVARILIFLIGEELVGVEAPGNLRKFPGEVELGQRFFAVFPEIFDLHKEETGIELTYKKIYERFHKGWYEHKGPPGTGVVLLCSKEHYANSKSKLYPYANAVCRWYKKNKGKQQMTIALAKEIVDRVDAANG